MILSGSARLGFLAGWYGRIRVARYFSEALPLHVADEEESVVPRLSGRGPDLDTSLARMHREQHHSSNAARSPAGGRMLQPTPEHLAELRSELSAASTLEREFAAHLEGEEEIILPACSQNAVGERRTRRNLTEFRARRREPSR
jgi:hypothetical protein